MDDLCITYALLFTRFNTTASKAITRKEEIRDWFESLMTHKIRTTLHSFITRWIFFGDGRYFYASQGQYALCVIHNKIDMYNLEFLRAIGNCLACQVRHSYHRLSTPGRRLYCTAWGPAFSAVHSCTFNWYSSNRYCETYCGFWKMLRGLFKLLSAWYFCLKVLFSWGQRAQCCNSTSGSAWVIDIFMSGGFMD